MQRLSTGAARWLLLSDLHFKHNDLDRIRRTGQWIVDEAARHRVGRVVICGDLLTSRSMQPTHVLSACYNFIGRLSEVVPRVNVLLGNHDLAYRRDYETTALNALAIKRLDPYVSVHSRVALDEWDGRRVLLLPFREEQDELVKAAAALDPDQAVQTVAFAHLAINKAITQRHVVGSASVKQPPANSIVHRGFTGPEHFASLARTFTGHFHSHQTLFQSQLAADQHRAQGSVTYLGSPLQLGWADLYDEQRGILLLDPQTLEQEMLVNPDAVGYTTVDLQQVLEDQADPGELADKHVMLLGDLSHFKYVTARDKLLSLGVRGVRSWNPTGPAVQDNFISFGGFGASVPAGDAIAQPLESPQTLEGSNEPQTPSTPSVNSPEPAQAETQVADHVDLTTEARKYVEQLDLDGSLLERRDDLVRIGQRMIQASHELAEGPDNEAELNYADFLDASVATPGTSTAVHGAKLSTDVFVAEPRRLTMTNFLGIQGTIKIDFERDLRRGLTFLVGSNGAGKSTLVEAIIWCQFGRCMRSGLAANDVVNDQMKNNCSVSLEFANGYTITRHRKHKTNANRVVVTLHGEDQPQLEQPDARTTQAAINELLGIDYDTFVRTVVLGHESAASFLSATLAQRRELIEASLGLSVLDRCGQVSKLLLKDIDKAVDEADSQVQGSTRVIEYGENRAAELQQKQKLLQSDMDEAVVALDAAVDDYTAAKSRLEEPEQDNPEAVDTQVLSEADQAFRTKVFAMEDRMHGEREGIQRLGNELARLREEQQAKSNTWLQRLHLQLTQRLEASSSAAGLSSLDRLWVAIGSSTLKIQSWAVRSVLRLFTTIQNTIGGARQRRELEEAVDRVRNEIEERSARIQSLQQETDEMMAGVEVVLQSIARTRKQLARIIKAHDDCNLLQQQVALKQRDLDVYAGLLETEQASLQSYRAERDAFTARLEKLAGERELFAFWSSATAKRSRRASTSSTKSAAKTPANFRDHVLFTSISELNAILRQVLTTMYDDTRHTQAISAGMLQSLFDTESETAEAVAEHSSVLDPSLAVNSSLSYGKRSGGERKRVDLALFFALMQLSWARSAHRARYLLVDEVFDSLDQPGQAAVVRLCALLSHRVADWIVVITHSQYLVDRDPEQDAGGKFSILRATSGPNGTQLVSDE